MRPLRIVQGYTGDIGRHQVRLVADSPHLELVGAYVHHAAKRGLDVGEVAGIGPLGVTCTDDLDEILALDADCVLFNPPMESYDEIVPMLASGKNVVSIMAGWHPHRRSQFPDLEAACRTGGTSLFGTGLNPGLSYELAMMASSVCCDVRSVTIRTCEPQATLSEVFLQMFGFGRTQEELAAGPSGVYAVFARTLHQVTDLVCEELGLDHDGTDFSWSFEPAVRDYEDKVVVRRGTMAGLLLTASTTLAGRPVVSIEVRFLLGAEYVREEWMADAPATGWIEVDVDGTPGSRITHEVYENSPGILFESAWATGSKAVNVVPAVCAAAPGVLSPADLPLPHMTYRRRT